MEISDKPRLINDSIVFEDEDGTFVYGQTIKKVANCKKFNDFAFKELRRQGFFVSAPVVENTNRKFSSLILLLSRDCLLCCRYCYADAGTSKAMMSAKVAEKAVEWYLANKPLRPKVSFIGGGEPTLNTAVLTNLINKYGDRLHWVVTTSGVVSERFLNWLMDNKVSVSFSIDGPHIFKII